MQFTNRQPSPDAPQKTGRWRVFVVALSLVILASIIWALVIASSDGPQSVRVTLHALPTHATIYINDEEVRGAAARLTPGTYSVRAKADGFRDYTGSYIVDPTIRKPVLAITLVPVSEAAKEYVKTHEQLYAEQERAGGTQARQQSEIFFRENPIAESLPYSNFVYTIGYKRANPDVSGDQSITIEISAPMGYRNAAVDKIRELGYNPADYTINFKDYINPFTP